MLLTNRLRAIITMLITNQKISLLNWSDSFKGWKCHHPHILSSRIRSCAIFVKRMPRYILLPDSPLNSCTTNVFNTTKRFWNIFAIVFTKQYKCPPYLYRDVQDETITLFYIHFFPKIGLWVNKWYLLYMAIIVLTAN